MSGLKPYLKFKFLENGAGLPLPKYQTEGASGMDLYAAVAEDYILEAGNIYCVPTGMAIELQSGFEAQVRARSGLALKFGLALVNGPGTIDSDYRGEIGIIMINLGKKAFTIERGMRIAQMVIQPVCQAQITVEDMLNETKRNAGGFGHTGH